MPVCIEPLAHERLRMRLYGCVGVRFSVVESVFALAQSNPSQSQIFFCDDSFMLLFTDVTYNAWLMPEAKCGCNQICALGNVVGINLDWIVFVSLSVYTCILYAPGLMAPLFDLCLQPARIPAGRVLHTDHREERDVEHADVRSPPHTEHEGHVVLHAEF